jgi:mycofactocin precursor
MTITAPVETAVPVETVLVETLESQVVEQELLVEDVSIDGMCGVY